MRQLCAMLLNMRIHGKFMPDGTRSGWIAGLQAPLAFDDEPVAEAEAMESPLPSPSIGPAEQISVPEEDPSRQEDFDPSNPFNEYQWVEKEGAGPRDGNQPNPFNQYEWVEKEDAEPRDDVQSDGEVIGSASSSSEEGGSCTDENEEVVHRKLKISFVEAAVEPAVAGPLMQNKRSRMLRKMSSDDSNHRQPVTECGLAGDGFLVLEEGAAFEWPKCSRCFRGARKPTGLAAEDRRQQE